MPTIDTSLKCFSNPQVKLRCITKAKRQWSQAWSYIENVSAFLSVNFYNVSVLPKLYLMQVSWMICAKFQKKLGWHAELLLSKMKK